jgi:hypothetical protein
MHENRIGPETFLISPLEVLVRRFLVLLRHYLDDKYFYAITSQLKRLRAFFRGSRSAADIFLNGKSTTSIEELIVCITHDIDSMECSSSLQKLFEVTDLYKIKTTVNVLTEGPYDVKELLTRIPNQHEIGLHGDFHDIAFGFRKTSDIEKRLESCIKTLKPLEIKSFRAPGLSVSMELLASLIKHGIKVDSSLASWPLFNSKTKPILHSLLSEQIFEVPLAISDDLLFRELKLNDFQTKELISSIANTVAALNGVLVMNFHPGVTVKRIGTYQAIVDVLARRPNTKFETISDAVRIQLSK